MPEAWDEIYAEIEDRLAPGLLLTIQERALYYHLLRHTRLVSRPSAMFAVAPLSLAVGMAKSTTRDVLRALNGKGCVRIEDRSIKGHLVSVLLPSEIASLPSASEIPQPVDIETVDFFTNRNHVRALLRRESGACFYCMKKVAVETCELDHLVPQASVLLNSYRNIVVACHGCNKAKGQTPAPDFVRQRYREGLLNEAEVQGRLVAIEAIQAGECVPEIESAG